MAFVFSELAFIECAAASVTFFHGLLFFVVRVGNKNPGCRCGGREVLHLLRCYEKGGVLNE